jgi:hypothetical protein
MRRLPMFSALTTLVLAPLAWPADTPPSAPELQRLDVAAGTWLYHGENLAVANQKGGKWLWREECGWSASKAFMACSFTMNNPDKTVKSLAVSTYNYSDKSYWHYEMFDSDGSGADPFIARMTIEGNTWTAYGKSDNKTYRVIYNYSSPTRVTVRVQLSGDNGQWTTLAQGEGIKQP